MKFFGKELKFNDKSVYHEGNKPMASDIKFSDNQTFQQKLDNGSLTGPKGATGATGATGVKGADGLTTSVTVNGTKYTHSAGNIALPNYPTLSSLGAASSEHGHNYAGSSSNGGSANTALKLANSRTITLNGAVSGSTTFDGSGNVTISTTSNTDTVTTINKSLTVSTEWIDTGISGTNIPENGSYVIQMFINNGANSGQYNEYYTGLMSWFKDNTSSTESDEIVLHKAGHSSSGKMVYLRTIRQTNGVLKLQIASSNTFNGAVNIVFKFKKLI